MIDSNLKITQFISLLASNLNASLQLKKRKKEKGSEREKSKMTQTDLVHIFDLVKITRERERDCE